MAKKKSSEESVGDQLAALLGTGGTNDEEKDDGKEIQDGSEEQGDGDTGPGSGEPDDTGDGAADDEDVTDDEDLEGDEDDLEERDDGRDDRDELDEDEEEEEDDEELDEEDEVDDEELDEEEEDEDDVASLKRQVASLTAQLNKKLETPKPDPKPEPEPEPPKLPKLDLDISDEDFETAMDNKAEFIKLLTKVADFTFQAGVNESMKRLPPIVAQEVNRETSLHQMVSDFYQLNPDLNPHKRFVGFTFEQVLAKNPDMDYAEAMQEAAKQVRKDVGLSQKGSRRRKRSRKGRRREGANLPDGTRGRRVSRRTPGKPQGIANEIAAMEAAGRKR
jgi:hypothetical protein